MQSGTKNLSRLESTILFILDKAQRMGIADLSRFQLMKLVYLIETESMRFMGQKFTDNIKFVRDKNGPISLDIYKAVSHLEVLELVDVKQVDNQEYGFPRSCHSLKGEIPKLSFADSEIIYLNSILEDYLPLKIADLKKRAYETEPMQEMQREEKKAGVAVLKGSVIDFDTVPLDEDILAGIMS